ncbi:MAG: helix-turn-helix domain-containing protein [Bythopirellula sp.]
MKTLPLTRSMHLLPIASILHEAGESVASLLQQSRLPSDCLDNRQSLIPSESAFRFRALAAQTLGISDVTLQATQYLEIADLGDFGKALLRAPTLLSLLTRFRDLANTQTTMAAIHLTPKKSGGVSFCHHFQHGPASGLWESDLYVLQWTIKVVRLVDPTWSPEEIWSMSPAAPGRERTLEKLGATVASFHRDCTGFVVPAEMFALPLAEAMATEDGAIAEADPSHMSSLAQSYSDSLAEVIRTYSSDRWLTIEEVAEVLGISTRSLQRRLSEEGTTFTDALERTRAELAGELLEKTDMMIAEIAIRLGYRDRGNFTRAFRRWSGVSPRVYRQQRGLDAQQLCPLTNAEP